MAAYEVLLLNTAIPQIQAAQSGDTYLVPRDIAFSTVASFAAGAEATPSIVATGDTNTGIWFPAADTVAISTGGISRLRLDSFGNLGLGVTPSAKLEIYSTNNAFNALQVRYNGSNDAMGFGIGNSNGFPYLGYNTKSQASVDAPVYERSNPAAQLRMDNGSFKFNIAPSGTAGDPISFTQAMTLDASGDLAIGRTSVTTIGTGYRTIDMDGENGSGLRFRTNGTSVGSVYVVGTSYLELGTIGSAYLRFAVNGGDEKARITSGGIFQVSSGGSVQVGGTAARATTAGTNRLDIFNGTAPVGTLTDGISIYSSSGEAYVMDAAGNATLFSPHDAETNEWIFKSKHTPTGKVLKIDVERLLKFVNDHFGLDAVHEFVEK